MKNLLFLLLAFLLSVSLSGHPRERLDPETRFIYAYIEASGITMLPEVIVTAYRNPQDTIKKSGYQKYWEEKNGKLDEFDDRFPKKRPMEYDDLYYIPNKDAKQNVKKHKPDTLKKDFQKDEVFEYRGHTTNIYRFYSPTWSWRFYDPFFYNDFYFGWNYGWNWNFYFGYRPFYYSYWDWYYPHYYQPYHWNNWNNHYSYNTYVRNDIRIQPNYGRRDRPSTLTQPTRRTPAPRNEYVTPPVERRITNNERPNMRPNKRPMYDQNRRSYTPSYEKPRLGTRPMYNNSKIEGQNRMKMEMQNGQQNRMENMGNGQNRMGNMNGQMQMRQSETRRNYNPPTQNYSTPQRNYNNPPTQNREFSSPTRSFDSGNSRMNNSSSGGSGNSSSGSRSAGSSGTGTRR